MTKFEDEAVDQISRAINVIQVNEGDVGRRLSGLHPTLQQGFMRVIVGFLQSVAKKDYVDARNERTRDLARQMLDGLEDTDLYLPLI